MVQLWFPRRRASCGLRSDFGKAGNDPQAAEQMLRWHVDGLPVADDQNRLVGMITYTDLLREFVGREEGQ